MKKMRLSFNESLSTRNGPSYENSQPVNFDNGESIWCCGQSAGRTKMVLVDKQYLACLADTAALFQYRDKYFHPVTMTNVYTENSYEISSKERFYGWDNVSLECES